MSLFTDPDTHAANPPATWQIVKAADRRWELRAAVGRGVLDTYTTRHAAEAAKTSGWLVDLYYKERRWYAGEPVAGWKPYQHRHASPAAPTVTDALDWDAILAAAAADVPRATRPVMTSSQPSTSPEWCQRWQTRRHSWRHTSEGGFNPYAYGIAAIDETSARAFVTTHHYSRSWPAARLRYGLIDHGRIVGVAVLGVPMQEAVLTGPFPTLEPYQQSLELSRLVLLDEVPANAESWFVARVFTLAAAAGVRGVVAFSDPVPRHLDGRTLMPGHVGIVYQALGAVYTGRGTARTLTLLPDGSVLTARAAAKVTGGERGGAAVVARLVDFGAPPKPPGQPGSEWLAEALAAVGARKMRHPGNHRYAWTIGSRALRRATPVALPSLPYPKAADLAGMAA